MRREAPAAQRNRQPILDVLKHHLPAEGLVLEIASGTGEHVVHFATAAPHLTFQPSDPDDGARASIDDWVATLRLPNVRPALALDVTPLQIGLAGESAQLFRPETRVMGLRLNLALSENADVLGFDAGLFSHATRLTGIQLNLGNWVDAEFVGVSAGLFSTMGSVTGVQAGLFNTVKHDLSGFQLGVFNRADDVEGFQVGLINRTVSLRGLQLGLINVVESGPVTFFPIVNAAF